MTRPALSIWLNKAKWKKRNGLTDEADYHIYIRRNFNFFMKKKNKILQTI